jgi:hypothetical protein
MIGTSVVVRSLYYYISFLLFNFLDKKIPRASRFIKNIWNDKKLDDQDYEIKNFYKNTKKKLEEIELIKNHHLRDKIKDIYNLIDGIENKLLSISRENTKHELTSEEKDKSQ